MRQAVSKTLERRLPEREHNRFSGLTRPNHAKHVLVTPVVCLALSQAALAFRATRGFQQLGGVLGHAWRVDDRRRFGAL